MIGISKKDVLHIVQQFFNYLTSKTIVSFEWSTEKKGNRKLMPHFTKSESFGWMHPQISTVENLNVECSIISTC